MWSQVAKCLCHFHRHTLMQRVFHYDEGDSSLMEVWVTEGWHISCSIRCRNSTSTTSGDPLCNRTKLCAIFWSKRRPKIKFRAIQQWVKHGKPNPISCIWMHLDHLGMKILGTSVMRAASILWRSSSSGARLQPDLGFSWFHWDHPKWGQNVWQYDLSNERIVASGKWSILSIPMYTIVYLVLVGRCRDNDDRHFISFYWLLGTLQKAAELLSLLDGLELFLRRKAWFARQRDNQSRWGSKVKADIMVIMAFNWNEWPRPEVSGLS